MAFDSSTVDVGWATKKSHFDQVLDNTVHIIESGLTFTGQKIFSTRPQAPGIDSDNTASNGVSLQVGYDISGTISLKRIYTKIIEIGDWNMVATGVLYVIHGLTLDKVRRAQVLIKNDDNTQRFPVTFAGLTAGDIDIYIMVRTSDVQIIRLTGGYFDSINFDSTSYNRGWIIIDYEE